MIWCHSSDRTLSESRYFKIKRRCDRVLPTALRRLSGIKLPILSDGGVKIDSAFTQVPLSVQTSTPRYPASFEAYRGRRTSFFFWRTSHEHRSQAIFEELLLQENKFYVKTPFKTGSRTVNQIMWQQYDSGSPEVETISLNGGTSVISSPSSYDPRPSEIRTGTQELYSANLSWER